MKVVNNLINSILLHRGITSKNIATIISLRNDDDDGNKNGKKSIAFRHNQNDNFARASRFFVHSSVVSYNVKRPKTGTKDNDRFNEQKNNSARASRFFVHFFAFTSQLRREMTKF